MIRFLVPLALSLLLSSCTYQRLPDIMDERIIQASRKGEIIKNKTPEIIAIASHLNQIDEYTYKDREYYLIEVYCKDEEDYELLSFRLNGEQDLWSRVIAANEFDEIINVDNKWARNYLVAFNKINILQQRQNILELVTPLGVIVFNFTFKELESQF